LFVVVGGVVVAGVVDEKIRKEAHRHVGRGGLRSNFAGELFF
jgi:hypothetical protein